MILDRMLRDVFFDAEVLFTLRMVLRKSGVTDSSIRSYQSLAKAYFSKK